MKIDEILTLVKAGYGRADIEALSVEAPETPETPETPENKAFSFDYAKLADELVKAQRKAAFHDDHTKPSENVDLGKFF